MFLLSESCLPYISCIQYLYIKRFTHNTSSSSFDLWAKTLRRHENMFSRYASRELRNRQDIGPTEKESNQPNVNKNYACP